jgi:hypothetical protein
LSVVEASMRISIEPPARRLAWAVTFPVASKSGTSHHVTVNASEAAPTKIPPPFAGSRSAKNGATRGAPARTRPSERASVATSPSPKVRLPSELTNAEVREAP